MTKFLIVDDHPLARTAIRALVESLGHTVVAETADGNDALSLIRELKPNFIIIDIEINNLGGLEVIETLRKHRDFTPAIVMSGKNPEYYAKRSARSGANGFISKKNNLSDLNIAIEAVRNGCGYFPLRPNNDLIQDTPGDAEMIQTLSAREFQVLQFLAQGMEVITISTRLKISNKTISTYKSRVMTKLGLTTRTELLDFIRRNNIS